MSGNEGLPDGGIILPDRTMIRVRGADKAAFFDRVLTSNFRDFGMQGQPDLVYSALLTPQGKVLGDLFCAALSAAPGGAPRGGLGGAGPPVSDGSDRDFLLDLSQATAGRMLEALNRYRLRAQIEFLPWPGLGVLACESHPEVRMLAQAVFAAPDPRPGMGWRVYAPLGSDLVSGPEPAAIRARRFRALAPDPAWDSRPDTDFALELNLDLLAAIDFRKGCFVGQEVTSRMKRKGRIRTRSRLVEIMPDCGLADQASGAAPPEVVPEYGARILANGLELGEIRSALATGAAHGAQALAVIRLDRWAEADPAQIRLADGRPVRLIGALED